MYPDENYFDITSNANYHISPLFFPSGVGGAVGGLRDRVDLHSLKLINIAFARGYQKVAFILHSLHT